MDEFRKPFEYFEEKGVGGILLVLFFMLISVEPLLGILSIAVGYNAYPDSKVFTTILIILSSGFIIFSLFSGIVLKKLFRFAVSALKVFLVYRLLYLIPVLIISMRFQIVSIPYEKTSPLYANQYSSVITSFVISISYVVVFSAGWFIYLVKSKKVQELFPQTKPGIKLAE